MNEKITLHDIKWQFPIDTTEPEHIKVKDASNVILEDESEMVVCMVSLDHLNRILQDVVTLATDLKYEIEARYMAAGYDHPTVTRRMSRDMEPAEDATTRVAAICAKYNLKYPEPKR